MERLSVADAAARLGVTPDAVRQRIRRGTMEYERDPDGRYYVYLTPQDGRRDAVQNSLADALQDQIDYLKAEVEVWREESRRKDHLLAAALERIPPQLDAPQDPPQEATGAQETDAPPGPDTSAPDEAQRRSWWRRMFGG